ncbi:MAG: hypothetical protein ABSB09_02885 [Acidimicrobiales bacterium]
MSVDLFDHVLHPSLHPLTSSEYVGGKLLRIFYDHWSSTGRDLHAAGRSSALWNALYTELTVSKMERAGA